MHCRQTAPYEKNKGRPCLPRTSACSQPGTAPPAQSCLVHEDTRTRTLPSSLQPEASRRTCLNLRTPGHLGIVIHSVNVF